MRLSDLWRAVAARLRRKAPTREERRAEATERICRHAEAFREKTESMDRALEECGFRAPR